MMKKLMVIVTAMMMVLMTACGSKDGDKKVIYVGTNAEYKPYEYLENGKVVGFDIDLMEEIGASMGYEIEWTNMSFDGLLPALQAGKVDMVIAGMTPTEERKKAVDFTEVYYSTKQAVLVNKDIENGIKTPADLKGKKIGVQLGTIQEKIALDLKAGEVKSYNSFTGAILDLNEDKIDAVIVGDVVAKPYLENNPKLIVGTVIDKNEDGSAIAMKKGSDDMIAKLNTEIDKIKISGKYDELVTKYFSN